MSKGILTFVDTVGVQEYIFRTNKLTHIVGASFLVDCATRDWLVEALPPGHHNVKNLNRPDEPFDGRHIETDADLQAEVLMACGGNALIAFRTEEVAKAFAYVLTRRILLDAPGLHIAVAHLPFDIQEDPLGGPQGCLSRLFEEVDRAKMSLPRSQGALGLGGTLQCGFTHAPAIKVVDNQPISTEVAAKLAASNYANQRLKTILDRIPQEVWDRAVIKKDFPLLVDDLGSSTGEKSTLAVIHIDGINMGERFIKISNAHVTASENRLLIEEQQQLSFSIQVHAEQALVHTIQYLLEYTLLDKDRGTSWLFNQIELPTHLLPLRPVLYGGDDVTFLCDGRIGLWLANEYLNQVSVEPLPDGKKLFSHAGVAIVKAHYPFARAYSLAEALAGHAKSILKDIKTDLQQKGLWNNAVDGINVIDWQISTSGQVRPLDEIRNYEYQVGQGNLTMRPVYQGNLPHADRLSDVLRWRSWENLVKIHQGFEKDWAEMHNKVKALPAALADGPDAVRNFVLLNNQLLPEVPELPEIVKKDGWFQNRCIYFDATELFDLLSVPLEETHERL